MKTTNFQSSSMLLGNKLDIVSVDSQNISQLESGIIRAYKDIFNTSSWREGVKCSLGCGFKTTFETAPDLCPNCSGNIEDFYSDKEVSVSIRSVLDKSYFQFLVLLSGEKVAGFSWGWGDSLETLNQEKLGLDQGTQFSTLITSLADSNISNQNQLYYLAEVGIVSEFQGRGVGKILVAQDNLLLRDVKDNIKSTILRTSRKSAMYKIQKSIGAQEVFSYDDLDERVLFAKNNY